MPELQQLLTQHFGVVTATRLAGLGVSSRALERLVAEGRLEKLRRNWYAAPDAHSWVTTAVRAGGVLTGPAALKLRGAWLPPNLGLHVRASRHDLVRTGDGIESFVLPRRLRYPARQAVDPVAHALAATILTSSTEHAVVLADSALQHGLLALDDLERLCEDIGGAALELPELVDPGTQSGLETMLRLWLRANGIAFTSQARIDGVGIVDFLVGDRLIIEIDGREHHEGWEAQRRDRERDRVSVRKGYLVLRFTYWEIVDDLEGCGADILAIVRARRHLARSAA